MQLPILKAGALSIESSHAQYVLQSAETLNTLYKGRQVALHFLSSGIDKKVRQF